MRKNYPLENVTTTDFYFPYPVRYPNQVTVEVAPGGVVPTSEYKIIGYGATATGVTIRYPGAPVGEDKNLIISRQTEPERVSQFEDDVGATASALNAEFDNMYQSLQDFQGAFSTLKDIYDIYKIEANPGHVAVSDGTNMVLRQPGDIDFGEFTALIGDPQDYDLLQVLSGNIINRAPGLDDTRVPLNQDLHGAGYARQVDSVSDLQSGSFPASLKRLWLAGYYGAGTAGGGPLYRDDESTEDDNGGTVFVDADGVRWKRPATKNFTLEMFGGGVAEDNTSVLQGIIDGFFDTDVVVIFWNGVYETDTLDFPPNSIINFKSDNGSTLKLKDASASGKLIEQSDNTAVIEKIYFEGLVFDGNHQNQTTFNPTTEMFVNEARVYNCTFKNVQGQGLRFPHVAEYADIKGNVFKEGKEHTGESGEATSYLSVRTSVDLPVSEKQHVNIDGNFFWGIEPSVVGRGVGGVIASGHSALEPYEGHRLTVTNNVFDRIGVSEQNNKISSIALYRRAGLSIVTGNRITRSKDFAIEVQGSPNTLISGNTMFDQDNNYTEHCIKISARDGDKWSDNCVVANNNIENWNGAAIISQSEDGAVRVVENILIQGNMIRNVSEAVHLRNFGGQITVIGNTIYGCTSSNNRPIYIDGDRDGIREAEVLISQNNIKQTAFGAINIRRIDGAVLIQNNTLSQTEGADAITVMSCNGTKAMVTVSENIIQEVGDNRFITTNVLTYCRVFGNDCRDTLRASRYIQVSDTTKDCVFINNSIYDSPVASDAINFDSVGGRLLLLGNILPAGSNFRFSGAAERQEDNNVITTLE